MTWNRSAWMLVLASIVGALFFWATDPRFGWRRNVGDNLIDAALQSRTGTFVGLAGCVAVLCIGLWMLVRRTV